MIIRERSPMDHGPRPRRTPTRTTSRSNGVLLAAAALCLASGALLLLTPTDSLEEIAWAVGRDDGFDASRPFDITVAIDTGLGTITSNLEEATGYREDVGDLEFVVSGSSGAGLVSLEARDPAGNLAIRDLVGPLEHFSFPRDPGDTPEPALRVRSLVHPETIPEPGGDVAVVIDVSSPAKSPEPVTVTWIGIEPFVMDRPPDDDTPAGSASSTPRCGDLALPVTLEPGEHVSCTHTLSLQGRSGDAIEVMAFADTVDPELGSFSGDGHLVDVGPPGPPIAPVPPPAPTPRDDVVRPDPVVGGIRTFEEGRYELHAASPQGSPGFELDLRASRGEHGWPLRIGGAALWSGGLFVLAGILAITAVSIAGLRRVAGAAVVTAGLAVPVLLAVTSDHQWYWNRYAHLAWMGALALAPVGAHLLFVSRRPKRLRRRLRAPAWLLGAVGALLALVVVMSSASYGESWVGGRFPGSYNGDYMFMGVHVLALQVAAPLLAAAAALFAAAGPDTPPT